MEIGVEEDDDYDEGRYLFCAGFGEEPHQTVDLQHEEALLALLDEDASLPLLRSYTVNASHR
jgi:hypothetical protein